MKINVGEIRVGMLIEYKNDLWQVLKTQHVKPAEKNVTPKTYTEKYKETYPFSKSICHVFDSPVVPDEIGISRHKRSPATTMLHFIMNAS